MRLGSTARWIAAACALVVALYFAPAGPSLAAVPAGDEPSLRTGTASISGTVMPVLDATEVQSYRWDGVDWRGDGRAEAYWITGAYTLSGLLPGPHRLVFLPPVGRTSCCGGRTAAPSAKPKASRSEPTRS